MGKKKNEFDFDFEMEILVKVKIKGNLKVKRTKDGCENCDFDWEAYDFELTPKIEKEIEDFIETTIGM